MAVIVWQAPRLKQRAPATEKGPVSAAGADEGPRLEERAGTIAVAAHGAF